MSLLVFWQRSVYCACCGLQPQIQPACIFGIQIPAPKPELLEVCLSPCDLPDDLAKMCCFLSWGINYFTSHKIRTSLVPLGSWQRLSRPVAVLNEGDSTACLQTLFLCHVRTILKFSSLKFNLVQSKHFPLCSACLCQCPIMYVFPFPKHNWDSGIGKLRCAQYNSEWSELGVILHR